MALECSGGGKLTEFVSYHVLGDVNRDMSSSVMDSDRMSYHGREYSAAAGPGLDNRLVAGCVHRINLLQKACVSKRSFF